MSNFHLKRSISISISFSNVLFTVDKCATFKILKVFTVTINDFGGEHLKKKGRKLTSDSHHDLT